MTEFEQWILVLEPTAIPTEPQPLPSTTVFLPVVKVFILKRDRRNSARRQ